MSVNGATQNKQASQSQQQQRQVPIKSANAKDKVDWNALIEAAVAQKKAPAVRINVKMKESAAEIAAFREMQGLMQKFSASLHKIRGKANSLTHSDSIFSVRKAYLTAKGSVDAKSTVVVTAKNGAAVRTYDLKILQLATAHKVAGKAFKDTKTDLNLAGEFSLKLEGAENAVKFSIRKDMSLAEIAETINGKSKTAGVTASVVKVSENEFKLVLNANKTGKNIVMQQISGSDIGKALGVTAPSGVFANPLQAAQDSIINLDGVRIVRDSNVVNDVIDGVTFSLYKETGAANSVSVEVAHSLSDINSAIKNLVETYNAYRKWAITQQAMAPGGGASKDAVLFGDGILRNANSAIADGFATTIDKKSMALLGLSYDPNNLLKVDAKKLNNALINKLGDVEKLLSFQTTSTSNDVRLLARNDRLPAKLSLEIKTDGKGNVSSVTADGKSGLFVVKGKRIVGAKGTAFEGVAFVFTGKKDTKAEFTFSAGLVERLHYAVTKFSDERKGILHQTITKMTSENKHHLDKYNKIMANAKQHRDHLIQLYSKYQKQIERAESNLDYLKAILGTK